MEGIKEEEKVEKKKKWIVFVIIGIIILLILVILFLIFGRTKEFTVTFDTDGGEIVTELKVKDGEIVELPSKPVKEGYVFVGWSNEEDNIITKGTVFSEDITLKAVWVSNDAETITLTFDTDGGNEINEIIVENGKVVRLPVTPIKKDFVFAGWVNEDGNIITKDTIVNKNTVLKALWISKNAKRATITFNTDGGTNIDNIIIEDGKIIRLPISPVKSGFVFAGWVDGNGNTITKDTIVNGNITLKATWKKPYTCPSDCTPIDDGSKCSKVSTTNMTSGTGCPSGYSLRENQCLDLSTQYDRDAEAENPRKDGECASDEGVYVYVFNMGAQYMCAKKTDKITTTGCPNGYKQDGDICKRTETLNCTKN